MIYDMFDKYDISEEFDESVKELWKVIKTFNKNEKIKFEYLKDDKDNLVIDEELKSISK